MFRDVLVGGIDKRIEKKDGSGKTHRGGTISKDRTVLGGFTFLAVSTHVRGGSEFCKDKNVPGEPEKEIAKRCHEICVWKKKTVPVSTEWRISTKEKRVALKPSGGGGTREGLRLRKDPAVFIVKGKCTKR